MLRPGDSVGFVKRLLLLNESEDRTRLLDRIIHAEREERRSRRAALGWGLATLICLGLLVPVCGHFPAWWGESVWVFVELSRWLAGLSATGFVLVAGWWLWNRSSLYRIQNEAERFVLGWLASRAEHLAARLNAETAVKTAA